MDERLKLLIEQRHSIWNQMQEIAERGFDVAENREQYARMETDLDGTEAEIAQIERHLARDASLADSNVPVETPEAPQGDPDARSYDQIFDTWLRHGIGELNPEERSLLQSQAQTHDGQQFRTAGMSDGERRALGTLSGAAGGFTVPEGFWNQIVDARKAFGGLRNAPVFQFTTGEGNDIPIPTGDDDSANAGVYIGENTLIGEQDISFDQKVLKAFTITSKIVRVPVQLLQDSAFDVQAYLGGKLGERIGRGEAAKFVSGTGLQEPEGLAVAAPVGFTVSGTNSFIYDDYVELIHSVDPAYRTGPSSGFLMSDQALKAARLITVSATDSRPIWQPGMVVGEPNTILGYPYWIDIGMDAVTTGKKPVAFGDLSNYWIRDVQGIQLMRLDERYAEYLQVAFLAFARNDARLVDAGTNPIKLMLTA